MKITTGENNNVVNISNENGVVQPTYTNSSMYIVFDKSGGNSRCRIDLKFPMTDETFDELNKIVGDWKNACIVSGDSDEDDYFFISI